MHPAEPDPTLPAVDERLVAPETRYEIEDGRVVYVPPADEPHGEAHANVAAVLKTHRGPGFAVAVDMLTRTSSIGDIAPDVSVYPAARNPQTGGRQLEHLAFEIVSTEALGHAGSRASDLIGRGVRRVFAIDVERARVLEWSPALATWSLLEPESKIDDPALAVAVVVADLLDAARADAAIARAYRVQRHPEFVAEHEEGRAEGRTEGRAEGRTEGRAEALEKGRAAVLAILASRGLAPNDEERRLVADERDLDCLFRWLADAAACASIADLLKR